MTEESIDFSTTEYANSSSTSSSIDMSYSSTEKTIGDSLNETLQKVITTKDMVRAI